MAELFIRKSIDVDAPVSTLWKILTDSDFIPQYMFGCRADTDWKPGSPLLWTGIADGKLYVKGNIVSIDPPHRLQYTVFDPNSKLNDTPSNYLTFGYELKARGDQASTLEISQGDFSKVEDGQSRYEHSVGGGDMVLEGIKKLAEAQVK